MYIAFALILIFFWPKIGYLWNLKFQCKYVRPPEQVSVWCTLRHFSCWLFYVWQSILNLKKKFMKYEDRHKKISLRFFSMKTLWFDNWRKIIGMIDDRFSMNMEIIVAKNCNNFHSLRQLRLLKSLNVNKFYPK